MFMTLFTSSPRRSTGATTTQVPDDGAAVTKTPSATEPPAVADPTTTVKGDTIQTRYGPVQVAVTIQAGAISDVTALQLPSDDRHSAQISSAVEPMLREAALTAQSAAIDVVSGATYTSRAYARSLQSALDRANG